MSNRESRNFFLVVLQSLGWPLIWGLAASVAFYGLIQFGLIDSEFVRRYFAGHPVEYVETALFFVGLAALILKTLDVIVQFSCLHRVELAGSSDTGEKTENASSMLEVLSQLPAYVRDSYLVRRLHDALDHVIRKGSADRLDEELKHLADLDADRQHEGYALVRIIIWATPMLGFLGTVIGITLALGGLSPEALVNSPEDAMQGLLAGLSVAFDTTALALSLAIILMFMQFMVNQLDTELLAVVDTRVAAELVGRFEEFGSRTDPQLASVRRMTDAVIHSTQDLVHQQAEIWQQTIDAAQERWQQTMTSAQGQLEAGLSQALRQSIHDHAVELSQSAASAQDRAELHAERLLQALTENAQVIRAQQAELVKQGDVMLQVVRATGEIGQLESSLNRNLQSLAGAKNFEETVISLSAAINLLSSRFHAGEVVPSVSLRTSSSEEGHAA